MTKEEIKKLIDKFYDGQTSAAEELEIADYFASGNASPGMEAEREFFRQYFALDKAGDGSSARSLERQMEAWNAVEKSATRNIRSRSLRWVAGIAASLLLLAGVGMSLTQKEDRAAFVQYEDTYNNPQDAYKETRKALVMLSHTLHKGMDIANGNNKKK